MRVVILENVAQVDIRAADLICKCVSGNAGAVLGLATGGTPLGTYRELVARSRDGQVDFANTTTFNLDEYIGLPPDHPHSYRTFMRDKLFEPAGFSLERCHLPEGSAEDVQSACADFERRIDEAGGIDLQLLGVGTDGHIAFNEPSSSLASRTRVKALTDQTLRDNARFFDSLDEVPKLAITMGIGTILEAAEIVLLATGSAKASAVESFIEGPVTSQVPASALQLHPRVTVVLDEAAASRLSRKTYYEHVEALQSELEQ